MDPKTTYLDQSARANDSFLHSFEIASGTVPGRRHTGSGNLLGGKNNQDAFGHRFTDDLLILTVHDGCGSTPYAEFGARLAANMLPVAIQETLRCYGEEKIGSQIFWMQVQRIMLGRIATIASLCTDQFDYVGQSEFARAHLLFTVLGAVVTPQSTVVFGIGDGVYGINGNITQIGPFPENAPDYLARTLMIPVEAPHFVVHTQLKTSKLETLLIGTDGVQDLIASANKRIPGKSRTVGNPTELFEQDCLFSSTGKAQHDSLTGWLRQINSEVTRLDEDDERNPLIKRVEGLLPDDTTLMLLRKSTLRKGDLP